MAWHFEAAPLFFEQAIGADEEGAALNAFDFLPYMILFSRRQTCGTSFLLCQQSVQG